MTISCPDDFDADDVAYAEALVPDGSLVLSMVTVVSWIDPDGDSCWRAYVANSSGERVASCLGLLELAKHDLIARSGALPDYDPDDDPDDDL